MNDDVERVNPYTSPTNVATVEVPLTHEAALRSLRRPAFGVLICAACGIVILLVGMAWFCIRDFIFRTDPLTDNDFGRLIGASIACAALVIVHSLACFGAIKTIRGNTKVSPWLAVLAGLIPLGPCGLVVVPFAIWLAILLLQRKYHVALASTA